jgi:hypothetical protein
MAGNVSLFRRDYLPVSNGKAGGRPNPARLFSFIFNTDALTGAGIFAEDRAIAFYSSTFQDQDLIIVAYCAVILVRYVYIESDGWLRLESRNPEYPTIRDRVEAFSVKGVVMRVVRDL